MSEYKSELRDSTIRGLEARVEKAKYQKYLKRMVLKKLRSFSDREITFDFPVTALVGPNGGGKTTILGAAGLVYKMVPPRRFFAKSGKYDANMKDWAVEYMLIDRSVSDRTYLQRTAGFREFKWSRNTVDRKVLIFGVARTVPATERRELVPAVGSRFSASREEEISPEVADAVETILGKQVRGYNRLSVDRAGRVTLFAANTASGDAYSEFHFGAGEASIMTMVTDIEAADDNSMILIEEIENGLHPVATRRLVEYLVDVAERKACQVIFTTHSNDALAPLPSCAIWAAYNSEVLQGKLDIGALRTITGQIDAKLAIFVEDEFTELMVTTALRYRGGLQLDAIKVHGMGGASPAVQVNEQHNVDPTSTFPSVCLVDGDRQDLVNPAKRVYSLPGDEDPEAHVFNRVHDRIDSLAAKLAVSMQLPPEQQDRVRSVVKDRAMTNRDIHVIYQQIGIDLDFTASNVVMGAFLAVWAQEYPDEVKALIEPFEDLVPAT